MTQEWDYGDYDGYEDYNEDQYNDQYEPDEYAIQKILDPPDDKLRVASTEQHDPVGSSVVRLKMKFKGQRYVGSGTIISDENEIVILSCGHNVMNVKKKSITYADSMDCVIKDESNKTICTIPIRLAVVYPMYVDDINNRQQIRSNDLAVLFADKTKDYPFGNSLMSDITNMMTDINLKTNVTVQGYPGDKKGDLWQYSSNQGAYFKGDMIHYTDINTYGGNSGSAIYADDPKINRFINYKKQQLANASDDDTKDDIQAKIDIFSNGAKKNIIGVHTFGSPTYNGGVRLTGVKQQFVQQLQINGSSEIEKVLLLFCMKNKMNEKNVALCYVEYP